MGRSGSGRSTLADRVASTFRAVVVHRPIAFRMALRAGHNVVVDDTDVNAALIRAWRRLGFVCVVHETATRERDAPHSRVVMQYRRAAERLARTRG